MSRTAKLCKCNCSLVKPPLATARAASCNGLVHLFVCLSVCLSPNSKNAILSKTKQFRAVVSIDNYRKPYMGFSKNPLLEDSGDPPSWKST